MDLDISDYTEEEERAWLDYGIVRGPVHDNFDVCSPSDYVVTFEWFCRKDGQIQRNMTDVYIVDAPGDFGQTVLMRSDSEWCGSYGSMHMALALKCHHMGEPWSKLIDVLMAKGKILWQRGGV